MKQVKNFWFPDEDKYFGPIVLKDGNFQIDRLYKAFEYVTDWTLAIDGGAHVGLWTTEMSAYFKKVIAFEPDPKTYECLMKNTEENQNVSVLQNALSNRETYISIKWDPKHALAGNTGSKYISHIGEDRGIKAIKLDDIALPSLGFLKLDVEGHEFRALQGAEKLIKRHKPVIMLECKAGYAKRFNDGDDYAATLLASWQYECVASIRADHIFKFKGREDY